MNSQPVLARPPAGTTIAAAVLSVLITIGLLSAVTGLFLHEGTPLQNVVATASR